jgi:NADPH-dependent 2,4-dienoyl-CoA reductase/sulfur reductase-like enzyme
MMNTKMTADVSVIGAGPAGLAAAVAAKENGAQKVVVIDREAHKGGILPQCIHDGFGLHIFGQQLTGPEYAARFDDMAQEACVEFLMETVAMGIDKDRVITAISKSGGMIDIEAKAIVLAMGCRERSSGALRQHGRLYAGQRGRDTRLRRYWFDNGTAYDSGRR